MLTVLRNLISSLFSFVLVITITTLIFLLSVTSVFSNKKTFFSILKSNNTFSKIVQDILPSLLVNLGTKDEDAQIPSEVILQVVENIDKSALASSLETLVDQTHDYVFGKSEKIFVRLPVQPYLSSISDNLEPSINSYIESLPICTASQEEKHKTSTFDKTLSCRPASLSVQQLKEEFGVSSIVNELKNSTPQALIITESEIKTEPEIIKFDEIKEKQQRTENTLSSLRKAVDYLNFIILFLLGVSIFLSATLFVSRLPHFASGFLWLASSFFSASIFPFIFGLLTIIFVKVDLLRKIINDFFGAEKNSLLAKSSADLAAKNLAGLANKISLNVLAGSFFLAVIAIVFFSIYLFLSYKTRKKVLTTNNILSHN